MLSDKTLAELAESDSTGAAAAIERLVGRHGVECIDVLLRLQKTPGSEADAVPKIVLEQVGTFLARIGEPPPMLVQETLPERSLILMAGKPKHGKSFTALDIADCVCRGVAVFGTFTVNRPGPVVYLAMEDGEYEVANRCLARGIRQGDARPLHICTQRFLISRPEAMAELRALLAAIGPVLLAIDTAAEALGIKDWSNRGEITEKMGPLRDLAREICTILLVAHNRKADGEFGDEIAGSNAFTGAVDGWLSTYRKEILGNGNLRLWMRKEGRGGLRGEIAVEMDTHNLQFTALSPEEIAENQRAEEEQQKEAEQRRRYAEVVSFMARQEQRRATMDEILRGLEWTFKVLRTVVEEMKEAVYLKDSGERRKREGAGRPAVVYEVTAEGLELVSARINSGYGGRAETNEPVNEPSSPSAGAGINEFFKPPSNLPYKDSDEDDDGYEEI